VVYNKENNMGYRSQVTSIIYGEAEKIDLFLVKHKILDSEAFTEFKEHISIVDRDAQKGIVLEGDWWKWYPEYSDVKSWHDLLADAEEFGLQYELVRVGEESGDVETFHSENCDWVLSVNTSIDNTF
jgi:hypothetical protein